MSSIKQLSTEEVNEIQEWFRDNHPYIEINQVSTPTLSIYLSQHYLTGFDFNKKMDCLKDYILANNLADVTE